MNIVGLCGSLRKESYHKYILESIGKLLPSNVNYTIIDINNIPFFNEDTEEKGIPKEVAILNDVLSKADRVIIATPEYNYSLPGALKNALDWVSRGDAPPLNNKKCAIISASIGIFGGLRSQYHLRQIGVAMNINFINKETFIPTVQDKFDENNNLIDERTIKSINKLIDELLK